MCYLMWGGRHNPARVGLLHLCTFLLLLLSGSRDFGVGLNKPFAGPTARGADKAAHAALASGAGAVPMPAESLPLLGEGSSYADVLIVTLHKLVVDGSPRLESLYSCFLTVIANVSPYAKHLSLVSTVHWRA